MAKEDSLTQVTPDNLAFLEKEFEQTLRPYSLKELTEKLAFHKTAGQRAQDVLKYDPACKYEVGDLIYKEYDEPLTVSSKTVEHFSGAVVLKIINKAYYKDFQCEMLEVDYTGGGLFRKYIDYMKKTRTQVLLPSNVAGKAQAPEKMEKAEDPRLTELPMTDRDIKALEKNLRQELAKSDKFFNWNDFWQLARNEVAIPEEKIKAAEAHLQEVRRSVATEEMANVFFGLEASHNLFDITCLSLNHALEKKWKKEFVFVSPAGWGRWHLKSILNSLLDGLPMATPLARLPELEGAEKPQLSTFHEFPLKIYLTWREVLSGGVKVPKSLNKELSRAREYTFIDAEEGKSYTVYYYPPGCFFLGLRDYFAANNIPQGASFTLERKDELQFNFWLKKSKKKLAVPQLTYDPAKDLFTDTGSEAFSFALPNKIIFLEKETLSRLLSLTEQRDDLDLRGLLLLAFKNFGLKTDEYSLHFLRAYHLVDILKQTSQEDVETTLLNSHEFSASEKKKGVFFYHEPKPLVEEAAAEIPAEIPEMPEVIAMAEEEGLAVEAAEEEEEEIPVVPVVSARIPEKVRAGVAVAPAKERAVRKKKAKPEGEGAPRPRKSERRVIEEKIELAESEQEALSAIKEKEDEGAEREELAARERKEEFKPVAPKEASFGLFAEKLKSALDKKKKEDKKK
ncbi:MAG: hypothetical protein QHH14_09215 [Clostridiales bacterium]|nr:hypothetical protein [Clostridiales bacterium]